MRGGGESLLWKKLKHRLKMSWPRRLANALICCLCCCGQVSPFAPRRPPPPDVPTTRKIPGRLRLIAGDTSILETSAQNLSLLDTLSSMDSATAEALAGPFFGASLFPYLGFLYFLDVDENDTPKGVTVSVLDSLFHTALIPRLH